MFRCYCILCWVLALALAWLLLSGPGPSASAQEPKISFINQVAPILKETCCGRKTWVRSTRGRSATSAARNRRRRFGCVRDASASATSSSSSPKRI